MENQPKIVELLDKEWDEMTETEQNHVQGVMMAFFDRAYQLRQEAIQ